MRTFTWSFEDASSYSKFLANQYGVDVSADSFGWFASQVAEMQQKVESEDQTFTVTQQSISLYELTYLPSTAILSKAFQQDVQSLPVTYDPATYLSFIQAYGTHVVVSATLGGKSSYKSFADSTYTESNSNFVLGGNARSDFYEVKGSVGGDYSHKRATSDFKLHGVSNYEREGGDPTIDTNQWHEWVDTIGDSPVVIKSQLKLISDFVSDDARRANIRETILKYSSNNTFGQSSNTKAYQMSQCNCYTASLPSYCQDGYLMQGTALDNGSLYASTICCRPCYSWAPSSFSDTLNSQATPKKEHSDAFVKRAEARNKASPSKCGEYACIPGLDAFGVTFDVVKGQSRHIPAIEFTFSEGKTWQNPWEPNLVYAVPDQVQIINNPEESQYYELINSTESYRSYLSSQAGLDVSFLGFGLSDEVSSTSETLFLNQNVLTILSNEFTFYKLALSFHWNMSQEISAALKHLASDSSSDKYVKFFQSFGTHYISAATYGGKSKMLTAVNENYYSSRTQDEVEAMVGLMYDGFSLGFNDNVTDQTGFDEFYSSSFSEFYLEGGNYLKYSADQLKEWKKSIIYAPTQLQYSLHPISSLISDLKLRQEFLLATKNYSTITPSNLGNAVLEYQQYQGFGEDQSSCGNGWATSYNDYQDGTNHYMLPIVCTIFRWNSDALGIPQQCNCDTTNSPFCPANTFVTGATPYTGWTGWFPKLPLTCCGMCISQ